MMGKRVFAPKLYYQLSLDQLVPQNHLLRQIANAVDFSFVYPFAKSHYSHTGQPSVDPVVIFKTMLIGYFYGITSERRLMSEIQVNLAYRWFLGYDFDEIIPDHSVLTKARSRFGMDVFEKFFEHSIQLCKQAGLLGDGPVYVDATHVGAAASLESLVKREEYVNPPMPVKDYIQKVYQENPAPREEDSTKNSPPSGGKTAPRYETWVNFDHELQKRSRSNKNREYVSYTDPESTIIHSIRGGLKLAYKAHMAVSGERGLVVTAAIATTGIIGEEHLLEEVLKCHTRYTKIPAKEVVADTRYGTLENYVSLDKAEIAAYIPPHERTNGINGFWGKDQFQYIPEQDIYLCPAGESMKNAGLCQYNRRITYRCTHGTCQACRLSKQCTKEGHSRIVTRFVNQRLIEEARKRTGNPLGKELMRQRKTRVEGIFALGKELHGMRRTRLMGRWKVQIQLWMTGIVINLKRAVKALNKMIGQEKSSNQFGSLPLDVAVTNLTFTLAYISSD